jgi:hypothetical protein
MAVGLFVAGSAAEDPLINSNPLNAAMAIVVVERDTIRLRKLIEFATRRSLISSQNFLIDDDNSLLG